MLANVAVDDLHEHLVVDDDRCHDVDVLEGHAAVDGDHPHELGEVVSHDGRFPRGAYGLSVFVGQQQSV